MLLDVLRGNVTFDAVILSVLSSLFVIFGVMPIHELAHAWVAHLCGDDTAKWHGRLTFNPINHIDWVGAASILFFGFGWAKPVPVNQHNFKNPKLGMALVGLAGPVSNLLSAFVFMTIMRVIGLIGFGTVGLYVYTFLFYAAQISIYLAVFNLIPIPPLDGSKVLFAILPDRLYYKIMQYEGIIYYAVLFLMVTGAFSLPVSVIGNWFLNLFVNILS